jgi:hypothetical protein
MIAMITPGFSITQEWLWRDVAATVSTFDPSSPGVAKNLLAIEVFFDSSGSIMNLRASGSSVKTTANTAIRDEVNGHPEWSDRHILTALRERGAHFTPDQVQMQHRRAELYPNAGTRMRGMLLARDNAPSGRTAYPSRNDRFVPGVKARRLPR